MSNEALDNEVLRAMLIVHGDGFAKALANLEFDQARVLSIGGFLNTLSGYGIEPEQLADILTHHATTTPHPLLQRFVERLEHNLTLPNPPSSVPEPPGQG